MNHRLAAFVQGGLLSLSLFAVGCLRTENMGQLVRPTYVTTEQSLLEELKQNPQKLLHEVETIRGLKAKAAVPIFLDDDKTFVEAYDKEIKEPSSAKIQQQVGFFGAFVLGDESELQTLTRSKKSPMSELIDEQLVAFYNPQTRTIRVRVSRLKEGKRTNHEQRAVIAHEMEHAIQHQHFGSIPENLMDDDNLLALRAVIEGDAQVVFAGSLLPRWGLRRTLLRITEVMKDKVSLELKNSPVLRKSPVVIQDKMMFPYDSGLSFEAEMFRIGGWSLVNKTFTNPPISTEQILHPNKYLAGELPIPVDTIDAPEGFTLVSQGKVGELMIRSVLRQCLAENVASAASQGWGGDSYSVAKNAKGNLSLLWSTAWDDDTSAERFAKAVESIATCWSRRTRSGNADKPLVTRRGNLVSIVHGFVEEKKPVLGEMLFAKVKPRPANSPPVANVKIPPMPVRPVLEKEFFNRSRYYYPPLALTASIPQGGEATRSEGVTTIHGPNHESFTIGVFDEVLPPDQVEQTFGAFINGLAKALPQHQIYLQDSKPVPLSFGTAQSRLFAIDGTTVQTRVMVAPVCNGYAHIFLAVTWTNDTGRERAEKWLESITIGKETSSRLPLCQEVDPQ